MINVASSQNEAVAEIGGKARDALKTPIRNSVSDEKEDDEDKVGIPCIDDEPGALKQGAEELAPVLSVEKETGIKHRRNRYTETINLNYEVELLLPPSLGKVVDEVADNVVDEDPDNAIEPEHWLTVVSCVFSKEKAGVNATRLFLDDQNVKAILMELFGGLLAHTSRSWSDRVVCFSSIEEFWTLIPFLKTLKAGVRVRIFVSAALMRGTVSRYYFNTSVTSQRLLS